MGLYDLMPLSGIVTHITESNDFAPAFKILREWYYKLDSGIAAQIDELENRFFYFLRFIADGNTGDVSEFRNKMLDIVRQVCVAERRGRNDACGAQLRFESLRPEESLESLVSDYLAEAHRLRTDTAALTSAQCRARLDRLAADIFNRLWVSAWLSDDVFRLLDSIIDDDDVSPVHRELWINGIGLALLELPGYAFECGDMQPFVELLIHARDSHNRRISVAAFAWLFFTVYFSQSRHVRVPIADIAKKLADDPLMSCMFEQMVHTYRGLAEYDDEAGADLQSDMASFMSKLKFGPDGLPDPGSLDAADIERLQSMIAGQSKGGDFFAGLLGKNRDFPFFANLANWFLPFDASHSSLADLTDGEGAAVADMLKDGVALADSDKYAMLLSLCAAPASMRNMMVSNMVDALMSIRNTPEFDALANGGFQESDEMLLANFMHGIARFIKNYKGIKEMMLYEFVDEELDFFGFLSFDNFHDLCLNAARVALHSGYRFYALHNLRDYADERLSKEDWLEIFKGRETELLPLVSCVKEGIIVDFDVIVAVFAYLLDKLSELGREFDAYDEDLDYIAEELAGYDLVSGDYDDVIGLLARYYMKKHDYAKAEEMLHTLMYKKPESEREVCESLGIIAFESGEPDHALRYLEQSESNDRVLFYRAMSLWLLGRRREAVDVFVGSSYFSERAVERSDKNKPLQFSAELSDMESRNAPVCRLPQFDSLRQLNNLAYYTVNTDRFGKI